MSDNTPSFDELVGDDLDALERGRLQGVHDLLVAAGAPPELPPSLQHAPDREPARVIPLVRRHRYRFTAVAAAAVLALGLFGAGYGVGHHGNRDVVQVIPMSGAGGAIASIDLYAKDSAGNWPMKLEIRGLKPLPEGQTYALWLTDKGKLADQCGTFTVASGQTDVLLNAPFKLKGYDGWVVVRTGSSTPLLTT